MKHVTRRVVIPVTRKRKETKTRYAQKYSVITGKIQEVIEKVVSIKTTEKFKDKRHVSQVTKTLFKKREDTFAKKSRQVKNVRHETQK